MTRERSLFVALLAVQVAGAFLMRAMQADEERERERLAGALRAMDPDVPDSWTLSRDELDRAAELLLVSV